MRRRCATPCATVWQALRRERRRSDARDRRRAVRRGAGHLDRLRGDGKGRGGGRVAIVRGDFDWSDVGSWQAVSELTEPDADGNRGQGERVAIATRGHVRPFGGSRRRDGRRREPRHRRHAGCRAGRPPRPPAAREGSRRRAEGARPRRRTGCTGPSRGPGAPTRCCRKAPDSRSSASRSSPAARCRCSCTTAAASTGSSCAAPRA